jgi:internalin A
MFTTRRLSAGGYMNITRTISCFLLTTFALLGPACGQAVNELDAMGTLMDKGVKIEEWANPGMLEPMIVSLDAQKAKLTDADCKSIALFRKLWTVKLAHQPITDAGLKEFVINLSELRSLALDDTRITDAGLAHIVKTRNLAKPPRLEELLLSKTNVTEAGAIDLAKLKGLRRLRIAETKITDAGADSLVNLTGLQDLDVSNTSIGDAGLAALCKLPKLVKLNLYTTKVTDTGLDPLKSLPALKWLNLDKTAVSDAGLPKLKTLTNLEFLHLGRTTVSDAGLPNLAGLTKLKELHLTHTHVTPAGVSKLKQSLPGCKIVSETKD